MLPRLGLLALLTLAGCGRTVLIDDVLDAGFDAGLPEAGTATPADAGPPPAACPAPAPNTGRVWGTTPLGPIDFQNVWIGTEGPWSHSCPHVTVVATSGSAPSPAASFVVDFLFSKPPALGTNKGVATLRLDGKTATIAVTADLTRADGLTLSSTPISGWRTSLTFAAADGGWTLQGVVTEAPDCSNATWFCI